MSKKLKLNLRHSIAVASLLGAGAPALAQDFQGQPIEEIVVTGSLIRGTPEDAAIPVDQITSDDLDKQGAPPPLEMLKGLSYMNGIVGESNQFTSGRGQAAQGSASINMRGLGAARTLVLLNGKRLASDDANRIPTNAISRVEVLKDGGAVTYGSDAIGGVVNYITKKNVEGFELSTDYRAISDSDGDYNLGLSWGMTTENSDVFASLNYYHRSELAIVDRDWAIQDYSRNPQGGWAPGANPGATGIPGVVPGFVDPGCEAMGGVRTVAGSSGLLDPAGNTCRTRYTEWDNLVEEQDSYQFFTSYNLSLGANTELHLEALYADTDVPHAQATPSYTTANGVPSELTNPLAPGNLNAYYLITAANPGLQDMVSRGLWAPGANAVLQLNRWRPFFAGGNPAFGNEEAWTEYERNQLRLSAELSGTFNDSIGYTTSLTYSQAEDTRREWDIRIDRLQRSLRGFGGPNCTGAVAGANGCLWLNPFSTAYPTAPTLGTNNPFYDETLANSPLLASWLMDQHESVSTEDLVEFNFVLDGELGFELPGGIIGWAAGLQYRHEGDESEYSDFNNQLLNPCPVYGDTSCASDLQGASPYAFLATYVPFEIDREVKAVFGEMMLPITDSFTAQIAVRFEDYGDIGGDSFDPNLRLRWQATDWLAFRASAGTTFRAAAQASLRPVGATAFQFVGGNSTPVVTTGNPDLVPESSTNYNIGAMFSGANFEFNIDYWRFEIDDILTAEPIAGIVAGVAACNPAFIDRYVELSGPCGDPTTTINRVTRSTINGASVFNDGIDIQGSYTWDEVGAGALSLGVSATRILHFETETLIIDGITFEQGFDGVGQYNASTTLFPLPAWRGNVFLDYAMDTQNIRWTAQYVDSYDDQRKIFDNYTEGQTIDSQITHNLTYRLDVLEDLTVTASVDNITDEDPPFARTEINYDAVTHTPLGRTFKVGAKYRF